MHASQTGQCPLCYEHGGRVVWRSEGCRLVHAGEAAFPAFYRLICNRHVAEWSDLPASERALAMEAVTLVECLLREHLQPAKINLATLGNVVPHLHWHVIARFGWDSHFPNPVWGAELRLSPQPEIAAVVQALPALEQALASRLDAHFSEGGTHG